MAKAKLKSGNKPLKVGDRITIRAAVTAIWPDGTIVIYIPSARQNLAVCDDRDVARVEKVG